MEKITWTINYGRSVVEGFNLAYCFKDAAVGRGRNYDWEKSFKPKLPNRKP